MQQHDRPIQGAIVKITVNIDCTPLEAREFLGLPNIQPMQDRAMKQIEERLLSAVSSMAPDAILRNWMSFTPEKMADMFKMFSGTAGGSDTTKK